MKSDPDETPKYYVKALKCKPALYFPKDTPQTTKRQNILHLKSLNEQRTQLNIQKQRDISNHMIQNPISPIIKSRKVIEPHPLGLSTVNFQLSKNEFSLNRTSQSSPQKPKIPFKFRKVTFKIQSRKSEIKEKSKSFNQRERQTTNNSYIQEPIISLEPVGQQEKKKELKVIFYNKINYNSYQMINSALDQINNQINQITRNYPEF